MDRHEDRAPTRGQPGLLDQIRDVIRRLHYSIRTEQTYVDLDPTVHPVPPEAASGGDGGARGGVLTHLAVQGKVAASTQHAQDAANEENRVASVTPLPQDLGRSRHPNPPDRFLAA